MKRQKNCWWTLSLVWAGLLMLLTPIVQAGQGGNIQALADRNMAFAFDLYAELRTQPGNLFFSPYSISSALAMTYAGARGQTAEQMAHVLHFMPDEQMVHAAFQELTRYFQDIQAEEGVALHIANALWLQQGIEVVETFPSTLETYYAAEMFQVNFQEACEKARKRINAWVAEYTQQKIPELIPPGMLNAMTRFVLTNAIYFQGTWRQTFDEEQTRDMPFWVTPERKVTVAMMHQKTPLKYAENQDIQMLELPYTGQALSMLILLPNTKDGLAEIERRFDSCQLDSWIAALEQREVEVYLPRFKTSSSLSLSKILQNLGMTDAFSRDADFSGIVRKGGLFISEVIHKAFVDVNEEGTEAAAATAVVGLTSAAKPVPVPVFKADHPFVFFIREQKTGNPLFMGRIMNPAE